MKKRIKQYILPATAILLFIAAAGSFAILKEISKPVTNSFAASAYEYRLILDPNGGELSDDERTLTATNTANSHSFDVSGKVPTRLGYDFIGWADSKDAEDSAYNGTVTVNSNPGIGEALKTVYAVWKEKEPRLVDGKKFNVAIAGCTKVVFGKQETYAAEVSGIQGDSIDAYGRDVYKLYKTGDTAYVLTDTPDGKIYANESCEHMFSGGGKLQSIDFGAGFDTSRVTDMDFMFYGCGSLVSLDLSCFDTSNVTTMNNMFDYCTKMSNLNLSSFDTRNVVWMHNIFAMCGSLKELDLSSFNTGQVTDMNKMFVSCSQLRTVYVGDNWNTGKVVSSSAMFESCGAISGGAGTIFDVKKTDKEYARIDNPPDEPGYLTYGETYQCELTLDVNGGETADKVITAEHRGKGYTFDLSEIEEPTRLGYDFVGWADSNTATAPDYTEAVTVYYSPESKKASKTVYAVWKEREPQLVDGDKFKTAITGYTKVVFGDKETYAAEVSGIQGDSIDVYGRDVYKLYKVGTTAYVLTETPDIKIYANSDSSNMFRDADKLQSIDFGGNFDTSRVTSMLGMFYGCNTLTDLDLSSFSTGKVTNMNGMFHGCSALKTLDVSSFDTGSVTTMTYMFYNCSTLTNLDVSSFDTGNVVSMEGMFNRCSTLTNLDVSSFDTGNVTDMKFMFADDDNLQAIYVGDKWNTAQVSALNGKQMFMRDGNLIGEAGTKYDENKIDKEYARIDNPPGEPGYLTYKAPSGSMPVRNIPASDKQTPVVLTSGKQEGEEDGEEIC